MAWTPPTALDINKIRPGQTVPPLNDAPGDISPRFLRKRNPAAAYENAAPLNHPQGDEQVRVGRIQGIPVADENKQNV